MNSVHSSNAKISYAPLLNKVFSFLTSNKMKISTFLLALIGTGLAKELGANRGLRPSPSYPGAPPSRPTLRPPGTVQYSRDSNNKSLQ